MTACRGGDGDCKCGVTQAKLEQLMEKGLITDLNSCPSTDCGHAYGAHPDQHTSTDQKDHLPTIDKHSVTKLAVTNVYRHVLSHFATQFAEKHVDDSYFRSVCGVDHSLGAGLCYSRTTAAIVHFASCPAVMSDAALLLGDDVSAALDLPMPFNSMGITVAIPKKQGSMQDIFSQLKIITHQGLLTEYGEYVVPGYISAVKKRFYIRFLLAIGHEVLILEEKGLREPRLKELIITAPVKHPYSTSTSTVQRTIVRTSSISIG